MRADDRIRLLHMLDAAQKAVLFAQGRSRADLGSDRQLVLALVKEIEITGEAASQISESTRHQWPMIP